MKSFQDLPAFLKGLWPEYIYKREGVAIADKNKKRIQGTLENLSFIFFGLMII
jgi:hypothetical protein